jgi:N-acetylneuraminic acid mutarotase
LWILSQRKKNAQRRIDQMKLIYLILILYFSISVYAGWEEITAMPVARRGAVAVTIGDTIYLIGGKNNEQGFLDRVDVYYPHTDMWDTTKVPPLKSERSNAAAITFENRLYVIGGRDEDGVLNSVEMYDFEENKWENVQNMHNKREGAFVVPFKDHLHIFGGAAEYGSLVDDVERYDISEDKWENVEFEFDPPRVSAFSFIYNDTVFVFGGFYFSPLSSSLKLSPDTLWLDGPYLKQPRGAGSTALVGNYAYFIGGESSQSGTELVERYDLSTGEIIYDLSMLVPRAAHATAVHDNTIYVFGGYSGITANILNSVEAYQPPVSSIRSEFDNRVPVEIELFQNYPNPFNSTTHISFSVSRSTVVRIMIFDNSGRLIKEIFRGKLAPAAYVIPWNGDSSSGRVTSSGIYFVVLNTGENKLIRKVIHIK